MVGNRLGYEGSGIIFGHWCTVHAARVSVVHLVVCFCALAFSFPENKDVRHS